MSGSTFGQLFRVTTAGESHGQGLVAIVDGVPPGLPLSEEDLAFDLARRRPGQSSLVSSRQEGDAVEILSGVFEGRTTGTPVAVLIRNDDARSKDYDALATTYRPGHADFTYDAKFGVRDHRGGGRSSARETAVRVAAGAIAKRLLRDWHGVSVVGYVISVGDVWARVEDPAGVTLDEVEATPVRCPDPGAADRMIALIEKVRREGDSVGGVAEVVATGVPAGWGEPVFDKLKADLAKAMLSLPAVLGFEYGGGFEAAASRGSLVNDPFVATPQGIATSSNRHGGMLGGISSGMPIVVRCAVKPTSSIRLPQETVTATGAPTRVAVEGRHDPCLLPRFVPMAEAMMALVLADHALRQAARRRP